MNETLFISDLHLDASRPRINELFVRFIEHEVTGCEALYILGDLFEYWLGDDAPTPGLESVEDTLRALTREGVPVYFLRGNRDFLIGEDLARRSGITLLPGEKVVDLYGTSTLVMHGDTLCTDDSRYQLYRSLVQNGWFRALFGSLGLKTRMRLAGFMRNTSNREIDRKPAEIMDVNQAAVVAAMRRHGVRRLIHGHTHRPHVHEFELDGRSVERIVLGDWYEHGSVLRCGPDGCTLRTLE